MSEVILSHMEANFCGAVWEAARHFSLSAIPEAADALEVIDGIERHGVSGERLAVDTATRHPFLTSNHHHLV